MTAFSLLTSLDVQILLVGRLPLGQLNLPVKARPTHPKSRRYPRFVRLFFCELLNSMCRGYSELQRGFVDVIFVIHSLVQEIGRSRARSSTQYQLKRELRIMLPCVSKVQQYIVAYGD